MLREMGVETGDETGRESDAERRTEERGRAFFVEVAREETLHRLQPGADRRLRPRGEPLQKRP